MFVRLRRVDFADAHAVALAPGASLDARHWHEVLFARSQPSRLMRLRNAIVRPFGLKAPRSSGGGFPLLAADADEVVTGLDDRHLDFRVSVRADPGVLTLTTSVQFHGPLGRAYFFVVGRVHPVLVRRLLRRTVVAAA